MPAKSFDISKLQELASRAEGSRLTPATRSRILSSARSAADRSDRFNLAQPGMTFGRALAAAALLVVLALPAVLYRGAAPANSPADRDINLRARLETDGRVVLEWENGRSVHTIRRAGTTADLAKVDGIKVAGDRFVDEASQVGEIVYYQID